jgi:hypothetical protein
MRYLKLYENFEEKKLYWDIGDIASDDRKEEKLVKKNHKKSINAIDTNIGFTDVEQSNIDPDTSTIGIIPLNLSVFLYKSTNARHSNSNVSSISVNLESKYFLIIS